MTARCETLTTGATAPVITAAGPRTSPRWLYHGFVGTAAPGLRDEGLPEPKDVLDLAEPELYRTPKASEHQILRGAALDLFFACTGASMLEAAAVAYNPDRPLRGWIDLPGDGIVAPRTVPLPEIAAMAIRSYRKLADKISTCDRLFVDNDGGPMDRNSARFQFARLGERIGIDDGGKIPARLRQAYIAWLDASPDTATAAYLRGYNIAAWNRTDDVPAPSKRIALVEKYHPLGKLDREMLRREGPVARFMAAHPLRVLSPEGKKATAKAKATAKGPCRHLPYPQEVKDTVREAIDAGHDPKTVFAHYGVPADILHKPAVYKKRAPVPWPDPLAAQEDAIRSRLEGPEPPTSRALLAWLEAEHGVVVHLQTLLKRVKKLGLTKRLSRKLHSGKASAIDPFLDQIRTTLGEDGIADLDVVVALLAARGVAITKGGARYSLRARGIATATMPAPGFPPAIEADVLEWIATDQPPSIDEIRTRIERTHGLSMTHSMVSMRVKGLGGKARASMRSAVGPHLEQIKAYVLANPTTTWAAVVAWVYAKFGLVIGEATLVTHMTRLGVEKNDYIDQPRPRFEPSARQVDALLGRMRTSPAPSLLELRVWAMAAWGVALDPIKFRKLVGRLCRADGLPIPGRYRHPRWTR